MYYQSPNFHIHVSVSDLYIFPRLVHIFSCSRIGRPIVGIHYINRSKTHECGNFDWGRAIPFLGIFVSNFRYCVFAVHATKQELGGSGGMQSHHSEVRDCACIGSWLRDRGSPSEYTQEWQPPLSGVHSIMMEKLAQVGEGEGCMSTPFHYSYNHVQSCGVRSCWVGWYTHSPCFISIKICTL